MVGQAHLCGLSLHLVLHSQDGNKRLPRPRVQRDDDVPTQAFVEHLLLVPTRLRHLACLGRGSVLGGGILYLHNSKKGGEGRKERGKVAPCHLIRQFWALISRSKWSGGRLVGPVGARSTLWDLALPIGLLGLRPSMSPRPRSHRRSSPASLAQADNTEFTKIPPKCRAFRTRVSQAVDWKQNVGCRWQGQQRRQERE